MVTVLVASSHCTLAPRAWAIQRKLTHGEFGGYVLWRRIYAKICAQKMRKAGVNVPVPLTHVNP